MKYFKSFVLATMLASTQISTVDIVKNLEWCGEQAKQYGSDLLTDTTTQVTTLGTVVAAVGMYQYYHYNAALACLDGHPNSRIMHKSKLIYMSYTDFINTIEAATSYAQVLEFVDEYCSCFGLISDAKINLFIALANDLQKNNLKHNDNAYQDNAILENFKSNLITAQTNIREELINGTMSAHKRAHNLYSIRAVLDIINTIAKFFNN